MKRKHAKMFAAQAPLNVRRDSWTAIIDEIQREAFFNYEKRLESREPGTAETDWFAAERLVLRKHGIICPFPRTAFPPAKEARP